MVEPWPDINPVFWNADYEKVGRVTSAVAWLWRDKPCAPTIAAKRRKEHKTARTIQGGGMISKGMAGRAPSGIRWLLFPFGFTAPGSTGRGA